MEAAGWSITAADFHPLRSLFTLNVVQHRTFSDQITLQGLWPQLGLN